MGRATKMQSKRRETGPAHLTRSAFGAVVALGLVSVASAATPEADAERCRAAEALVRHVATGDAAALGEPAHSLRSASDQSIFASWPGGPPPREILVGLSEEPAQSVLQCSRVKRLARKTGLAIVRANAGSSGSAVTTVYASLPALSSDGLAAASVVSSMIGFGGVTQVVTLTKKSGEWEVSGRLLVSFS